MKKRKIFSDAKNHQKAALAKVIQTGSLAEKGNNSFHNQLFLCCDKVGSKDFIMIGLAIFFYFLVSKDKSFSKCIRLH